MFFMIKRKINSIDSSVYNKSDQWLVPPVDETKSIAPENLSQKSCIFIDLPDILKSFKR